MNIQQFHSITREGKKTQFLNRQAGRTALPPDLIYAVRILKDEIPGLGDVSAVGVLWAIGLVFECEKRGIVLKSNL